MSSMILRHAAAALLLAASGLSAQGSTAPPPLPVHVGGRIVEHADGSMSFAWPGNSFESRFQGTGVEVAAESGTEFMRVLVDGEEKVVLKQPGTARVALQGLSPCEHVVRLEKQTESRTGGGRFIGFYPLAGSRPLPTAPRPRQIEFIGDSYTVGYGNISPGRTCTTQEVHDRTDTQQAFGPLLAKRLDADYRVIAYSGHGMVRNYNGSSSERSLPIIYSRLLPEDPVRLETSRGAWQPQLIVVNLGTNDFSTPLKEGERWRSQEALRAAYRGEYIRFARKLMARQPQARLVLMGGDTFFDDVRAVAAGLDRRSAPKVTAVRFGDLEVTGCNYHPSLADHEKLAALLQGVLDRQPDLWRARTR